MFNVYVGYDTRLDEVYNVCRYSILRHSKDINVIPVKQQEYRDRRIYNRPIDDKGSTEFTITRFLVPYLNNYSGWSLFCDCDFLWTVDVKQVFDLRDDKYSIMVVKHDYTPVTDTKMDNKIQYKLPRKNWSSLMLFNNQKCTKLDLETINTKEPGYLHRLHWVSDEQIGSLPIEFNYLVGYNQGPYKALHYTDGGPWFENYKNVQYSELWTNELNLYKSANSTNIS